MRRILYGCLLPYAQLPRRLNRDVLAGHRAAAVGILRAEPWENAVLAY